MNFPAGTGLPIAAVTPPADVIDGHVVDFGRVRQAAAEGLLDDLAFLAGGQHVVFAGTTQGGGVGGVVRGRLVGVWVGIGFLVG
jgi:hypothetical protein